MGVGARVEQTACGRSLLVRNQEQMELPERKPRLRSKTYSLRFCSESPCLRTKKKCFLNILFI